MGLSASMTFECTFARGPGVSPVRSPLFVQGDLFASEDIFHRASLRHRTHRPEILPLSRPFAGPGLFYSGVRLGVYRRQLLAYGLWIPRIRWSLTHRRSTVRVLSGLL